MLLCFFITGISFFLFLDSIPLKPLPPWASERRLVSFWFWTEFSLLRICKLVKNILSGVYLCRIPLKMSLKKKSLTSKGEVAEEKGGVSIMDLPELALECILERLPADSLVNMAGVCRFFREKCKSDHLWRKHMQQKWGRVIGQAAYREWQWHIALKTVLENLKKSKRKRLMRHLSFRWSFSRIRSKFDDSCNQRSFLSVDSIMSWYLALENGKFWFPAQVYNRENGHEGFVMSCYDAEVCYDPRIDAFQARYPPHGRRAAAIENGVQWERLRAPPVDIRPHKLYISDCLNDLRPGDHVEIQWRRIKEYPYGWWYAIIGHLETCVGNAYYCLCDTSDTVVLEFNQYTPGSEWGWTTINRKAHTEEGNEMYGFYGGIIKLESEEQISKWKSFWPTQELQH